MTSPELEFVHAFEKHDVAEVRRLLDSGIDAAGVHDGKSLVNCLVEMYIRSDRFPDCLRLMLDRGGTLDDPALEPVLMNDPEALREALERAPELLNHRTSLDCTFSSLRDVSLLHVAAEYGHESASEVLLEAGLAVDTRAGIDEHGMNGHTPLFHTVNSHRNRSAGVMRLLLDHGADASIRLDGLVWGRGFDWETTFFDVTPVSFAQMGLLPQVHREEADVYASVQALIESLGRTMPPLGSVPNRYVHGSKGQ